MEKKISGLIYRSIFLNLMRKLLLVLCVWCIFKIDRNQSNNVGGGMVDA